MAAESDYSIFEHDDAADWIGAFESDGLSSVKAALELVAEADAGSYIEIADAAPAMAAAEIVAAARDDDASRLPKSSIAAMSRMRTWCRWRSRLCAGCSRTRNLRTSGTKLAMLKTGPITCRNWWNA
jgi:hypothetical protein